MWQLTANRVCGSAKWPAQPQCGAFRYTGSHNDPETGLYYYRARYYSPKLGRFLQTDPIGTKDDLNLYAYTYNDPVNAVDPTGLSDLNLFGSADGLFAANQAMDIPGVYTITGHGNPGLLLDQRNGRRVIDSAADLLKEMRGYVVGSGEPIFIGACNVGKGPIPQELANLTGGTVYAANGYYFSPTTKPEAGGVAYQPGDRIDLTVNSAQDGNGDAGAFNAVYPEGQSPSDLQPPGRLASVTVRTDSQSASFRVDRIAGRIDSQRNAAEDRKKRLGER